MEQYREQTGIMDFDFEDAKHVREHSHPDIEIIHVLEGCIVLNIAGREYRMQQDDLAVINSGEKHSYRTDEAVLTGIVHIKTRMMNRFLDMRKHRFSCNSSVDRNEGYREVRKILGRIFPLFFDKDREGALLNSLYFYLLHLLITNFSVREETGEPGEGRDAVEQRNREIILFVQENFRSPVSLGDLAERLHLSESYLSKYVKKNLRLNFGKYLNHVRLEYAVEEMRRSEKSLTRIALDSGFANTAAFTQAFKEEYGQTPSSWLKEHREELKKEREDRQQEKYRRGIRIKNYLEKNPEKEERPADASGEMIEADAAKTETYQRNWNRLINVGSVEMLLRSDVQEHLLVLKRELGFEYVRFWNIFSDEMLLGINKSGGTKNFSRLNKVFDFLIENGMHSFIELGFKPVILMRSLDQTIVSQEQEIAYNSKEEYRDMLYTVLAHCVNRYGLDEVEKWYFEQWADPRITSDNNFDEYFEIFEAAYYTLKSISPKIHMGGAGFGRLYTTLDFDEIMEMWSRRVSHPDFISMYSYPYMARSKSKGKDLNEDRIQDSNYIRNQVLMMKEVMNNVSMAAPELLITEWSSSVSNWNGLNDSLYKGAFLLKSIIDNISDVNMTGYWMATDLLAEYYDTGSLLHGGNGLLSVDGIRKPAFYAFQFANRMGELLLSRSPNAMITTNGRNSYVIVCHNYIKPNYKYFLKKEDEVEAENQFLLFEDADILHLNFRIRNVKDGKYILKIRSLNKDHGSVQDEWAQMKYSENLNRQDIGYLRDISTPQISVRELSVENGVMQISTSLKPHEIQAFHIIFQVE